MAEDRRHDAEATPAGNTPGSTVTVAETPADSVQTHNQSEIEPENLRERADVLPMDSVPPADQKADVPAEFEELRQPRPAPRPAVVDNERRYGPLSGSMWFLVVAVAAFVLAILLRLLS